MNPVLKSFTKGTRFEGVAGATFIAKVIPYGGSFRVEASSNGGKKYKMIDGLFPTPEKAMEAGALFLAYQAAFRAGFSAFQAMGLFLVTTSSVLSTLTNPAFSLSVLLLVPVMAYHAMKHAMDTRKDAVSGVAYILPQNSKKSAPFASEVPHEKQPV